MANRASKGSAFEREICKRLSLWWTQDEPEPQDDVFWRTSNSGGRATVRSRKGKRTRQHHGDVCAVDERGRPFTDLVTIELKRGYNRATLQDLLDKPDGAAEQTHEAWLRKARENSEAAGSYSWLLIVKRDKREPLVLMDGDLFWKCELANAPALVFPGGKVCKEIHVHAIKSFLAGVKPSTIKKLARACWAAWE